GKRKVKRQPQRKLKEKLDSQFNCLFCNHEKAIECKIDHANKVGHLNYLDEPVDVYSAWIDACEDVNYAKRQTRLKDQAREREREERRVSSSNGAPASPPFEDYDDDEY
ncbi:hypothetical protein BCR43DRAFT_446078, partial [Syncephalastrum racemosum]